MAKKVEYEGKKYRISTSNYGYSWQKMIVNGEHSSIEILNEQLNDTDAWRQAAKKAIHEYENRQTAKKTFSDWDGKL